MSRPAKSCLSYNSGGSGKAWRAKKAGAAALAFLWALAIAACGGSGSSVISTSAAPNSSSGSSTTTAPNVVPVVVNAGPAGNGINTLYTTVTICVPGSTTECQTIDDIQVDTGSYGLRILAPVLTITLPVASAADGNSLLECTQFVDGYSWGPVASADVKIGGEAAASVPVQVIGSSNFPNVPADCAATGAAEDTVATFGANGILGIGVFAQDCGAGCATNAVSGNYYSCTQTACAPIAAALTSQVANPVASFVTDNNGTIITLPSVGADGAAAVTGSLIFGIDTESNNASGTQTVLTVEPSSVAPPLMPGDFTIEYAGQTLSDSFIDSGTNGIFFNDPSIPDCSGTNQAGFYCPPNQLNLSATLMGVNGVSTVVEFSIGNAQTLSTSNPSFTALPTLGGSYSSSTTTFDWGLPFFFGRRVATAIENASTRVGTGPYVAF